jgi:hypothetical protein
MRRVQPDFGQVAVVGLAKAATRLHSNLVA